MRSSRRRSRASSRSCCSRATTWWPRRWPGRSALAKKLPGTFDGGAQATQAALTELGVNDGEFLVDGSGLSDDNRVTAKQLTDVLVPSGLAEVPAAARDHVWSAGGRVLGHPDQPRPRRPVWAACGRRPARLNRVNALAGYVVDADGRLLAFAVVADATDNRVRAEGALDRVAAGIASCGCR